jgi:hypothetical protein
LVLTRTAGTASVVAAGGSPPNNSNGDIGHLFRITSGSLPRHASLVAKHDQRRREVQFRPQPVRDGCEGGVYIRISHQPNNVVEDDCLLLAAFSVGDTLPQHGRELCGDHAGRQQQRQRHPFIIVTARLLGPRVHGLGVFAENYIRLIDRLG